MGNRTIIGIAMGAWLLASILPALADDAPLAQHGPALSVDLDAGRNPIDPAIYGMAYPDRELAKEIRLPVNRWGGDATTRYNWQVDASNAGDDWFFMTGGNGHPTPSAGPDALITFSRQCGGKVLLTIPIIDYINKASDADCTFPVSIFGKQQKTNPYVHPIVNGKKTDAGNGRTPDGKPIVLTREQLLRIHISNTPDFQRGWIEHLIKKFGTTASGGVGYYELDNEPGGWGNTHRDVHPGEMGHDELVSRSIAYAAMIKTADSSAIVVGPGDFVMHYQSDGKPGDGKKEHGGLGQGDYYLQQMAAYEQKHHVRLIDYFDEHYYPIAQDGQTDATRLQSTRSLWDPTYKEKNWVGKWRGPVNLIPQFHQWVDKEYPGTKISISEYGWGEMKTVVGALCEADVLGIFGREKVDMACMFGPPKATEAGANAFRMYLNYDGNGSRFGDVSLKAASADQDVLSIYAAQRSTDKMLTIIVINKTEKDLTALVVLKNFKARRAGKTFRYSAEHPEKIVLDGHAQLPGAGEFDAIFFARSITLYEFPAQ